MDSQSIFTKTAEGLDEIATRARKLAPRMRALLIMVDGQTGAAMLAEKGHTLGAIGPMLAELEAKGLIKDLRPPSRPDAATVAAAPGAPNVERSIAAARRYAIEQMLALLGPGADPFTARLEATQDRAALLVEAERCREVLRGSAGAQKADRFWTGLNALLA